MMRKKYKLIAFDLDGTLAKIGEGIIQENVRILRDLEKAGMKIVVCSGKAEYYLCGLLRQVGLRDPYIVGENGAVVRHGIDLPPKEFMVCGYSDATRKSIMLLRREIENKLPDIYFQPNTIGLTPFPRDGSEFDVIQKIIDEHSSELSGVTVYRHADSFDITPNEVTKYAGMSMLSEMTGIKAEEMIAVGDGVNDYPMFDFAGLSIGIRLSGDAVDISVNSIEEALDTVEKHIKEERDD